MSRAVFIPSNGIGEIYLHILDMHSYMYNSSCSNLYKKIPFSKVLLDMASLRMRYCVQINSNRHLVPQTLLEIGQVSTYLIKSLITIKCLSEDFDFFIADKWEIAHALKKC